jgi:peptidyl-prolyl cis-trans isomerase B (cyclophilin B)
MAENSEKVQATIAVTSKGQPIGDIVLKFFSDVAPGHVTNFIKLSKEGF